MRDWKCELLCLPFLLLFARQSRNSQAPARYCRFHSSHSPSPSRLHTGADQFVSSISNPSASFTSHESSSRIVPIISPHPQGARHSSSAQPRKQRTSLLIAATDALGLRKKLGSVSRKKHPSHDTSSTNTIPDVIEISAHYSDMTVTTTVIGTTAHMDREHEERERLRGAAAQSIGIDPDLLHQPRRSHSLSSHSSPEPRNPLPPSLLPPFPATLGALSSIVQMSATLPRFTPASSLLVYALAKQWKVRTLVLTSHVTSHRTHIHLFKGTSPGEVEIERLEITENSAMFVAEGEVGGRRNVIKLVGKDVSTKKSANTNNNTSGASEDPPRAMWFLQITDPAESQRWISAIKNAVLSERSLRAGLGIPVSNGAYGPRGDMDVMLSMRMQGMISPQPSKKGSVPPSSSKTSSPSPPPSLRSLVVNIPSLPPASGFKSLLPGSRSRSPSLDASHSPVAPQCHAEESFGVMGTSLLTMFRGNTASDTSSSPSRSLSLPLPQSQKQGSPAASVRSASTTMVITASELKISKERDMPGLSSPPLSITSTCPDSVTPPAAFQLSMVPLPLQPPPRKPRCTPTAPIPIPIKQDKQEGLYRQANGNRSVAGSFGIRPAESSPPPLPPAPGLGVVPPDTNEPKRISFGDLTMLPSPDVEPTPGLSPSVHVQPVSPVVSAVLPLSPDSGAINAGNGMLEVPATPELRSSSSSTTKRWSRLATSLPQRPDPPPGPLPTVPGDNSEVPPVLHLHVPHPYAGDGPSSTTSTSSRTDTSPHSTPSPAQSFWRRISDSSAYSVNSWSTSDSRAAAAEPTTTLDSPVTSSTPPTGVAAPGPPSRSMSLDANRTSNATSKIVAAKRRSMPPPRPPPTHALPPAPIAERTTPLLPLQKPASSVPASQPQKSLRASAVQRALRLSLTSPKPPPSSSLPPRPDEPSFVQGHRRSSSNSTIEGVRHSELPAIPGSPPRSPSQDSSPNQQRLPSSASVRSVSLKQRLRILSAPSPSPSPSPQPTRSLPSPPQMPTQVEAQTQTQVPVHAPVPHARTSTLDFIGDEKDPSMMPSHAQPQPRRPPFGLGEHIMNFQNDPSFLSLSTPDSPTIPRPPPRSPFRPLPIFSASPGTPMLEGDFEFMSLSPPPRRGSKQLSVTIANTEKGAGSDLPVVSETEPSNLETYTHEALSAHGSVVSLGFITM
ncbi:hypothetical protein V8B97DRAFT_206892 [Scleroderma yunnanense]